MNGHLILGAGCAGLSLAVALLDEGEERPITLIDARTEFSRDRTWCLFDVGHTPFSELAGHRWSRWRLAGAEMHSTRHPYLHLDSADVYAAALERLERAPNVELRLGERVLEVGDGWARTERATHSARWAYDALALGSPALRSADVGLWQTFLGLEVETERPAFDPEVAVLMDFHTEQGGALSFLYVLPFDRHRALVEHTSIGPHGVDPALRERAIGERLAGHRWRELHREHGRIPMTTGALPGRRGERTIALGTAGGAVRPSSGYAFARIQAQVARAARATARDHRPAARGEGRRGRAMDSVFLDELRRNPQRFPAYFEQMARAVPGDAFARFMGDASSALDDARVVSALPKPAFAVAALRAAAPG